jgi:uncharacterized protein with FMN-binding domain
VRRPLLLIGASTLGIGATVLANVLGIAKAEVSAPPPPDVNLDTYDVTTSSGVTVAVRSPQISLVTTSDKSMVSPGSSITYTYTVKNISSDVNFKNVSVEDDKCSPVTGPTGDNGDKLLNAGETWTFQCKTVVLKDQTNKATVHATAVPTTAGSASPSASATPSATPSSPSNGVFTGSSVPVNVPGQGVTGNIQVVAVVSGGKLTAVQVPTYPTSDLTSKLLAQNAIPTLTSEALAAQSSKVAAVAGATYTSQGFSTSLANALAQAGL